VERVVELIKMPSSVQTEGSVFGQHIDSGIEVRMNSLLLNHGPGKTETTLKILSFEE
jgi:hypothetical protein